MKKNEVNSPILEIIHFCAMKPTFLLIACLLLSTWMYSQTYRLIAHRGGVVDSMHAENSLQALESAIQQGYWMAELDLRLTGDSVFVLHHDRTLKKFGVDKPASAMTWIEISKLRNNRSGSSVITLEDALRVCRGKMQVMIDNKIAGNDTLLFNRLIQLLEKYNLLEQALMIGTDESTPYFTGKIKLSCSRQQLEDNKKKPGFNPGHYYLFGNANSMTAKDVAWANKQGIMVVGVVNRYHYRGIKNPDEAIAADVGKLKSWGVNYFQIDSEFSPYFSQ
jgi:glycerophosphoryl diester phosphodiesterase